MINDNDVFAGTSMFKTIGMDCNPDEAIDTVPAFVQPDVLKLLAMVPTL